MIHEIVPDQLWAVEQPFKFLGNEIGARMSVCRLQDGSLWAYAPFDIGAEDAAQLKQIGEVRHAVAPSTFHTLEVQAFVERFPSAQVWAMPEISAQIGVPHTPLEELPPVWRDEFDALKFDGALMLREWDFCHRATRTLLVTDLLVNLPPLRTPAGRFAARIADIGRGPKPTRLERLMITPRRSRARTQIAQIQRWNFERIVMAHGRIVEQGGKTVLQRAYRWL